MVGVGFPPPPSSLSEFAFVACFACFQNMLVVLSSDLCIVCMFCFVQCLSCIFWEGWGCWSNKHCKTQQKLILGGGVGGPPEFSFRVCFFCFFCFFPILFGGFDSWPLLCLLFLLFPCLFCFFWEGAGGWSNMPPPNKENHFFLIGRRHREASQSQHWLWLAPLWSLPIRKSDFPYWEEPQEPRDQPGGCIVFSIFFNSCGSSQ